MMEVEMRVDTAKLFVSVCNLCTFKPTPFMLTGLFLFPLELPVLFLLSYQSLLLSAIEKQL